MNTDVYKNGFQKWRKAVGKGWEEKGAAQERKPVGESERERDESSMVGDRVS